jgi:hypothetical protein
MRLFLCSVALILVISNAEAAGAVRICVPAGTITFDIKDADSAMADQFMKDVINANTKVGDFMERTGIADRYPCNIQVYLYDFTPPVATSMDFAWNGALGIVKYPVRRINEGKSVYAHELAHIHSPNNVRYLAEGLAVFLEEIVGNINGMPTFGKTLEFRLRTYLATYPMLSLALDLAKFDQLDVGSTNSGDNMARAEFGLANAIPDNIDRAFATYTVSASFVKFLIQTYGIIKFKGLYDLTPFKNKLEVSTVHSTVQFDFWKVPLIASG